ncbi:CRPV-280 [Crowpox virus]|nr:CRPV-280 [Crowpox virus]
MYLPHHTSYVCLNCMMILLSIVSSYLLCSLTNVLSFPR